MAALMDAIDVKRKTVFEFENTPYACLDADIARRRRGAGRRWCV